MILPWNFSQPENMRRHNQQVADGEYKPSIFPGDLPASPQDWAPRVLDIGACCGAFAWWVTRAFPAATVACFEPNQAAFGHLSKNRLMNLGWEIHNLGVRAHAGAYRMLSGANNLGEASMHDLGEQDFAKGASVECVAAADLPDCDWLKVDTEGCEVEIIGAYLNSRESGYPRIVSFEFHRATDFNELHNMLTARHRAFGYALNRADIRRPDRGTCVFVREL